MKILLRYLYISLLKAFVFCLFACLLLLFIADLFSSLDEFIQNRDRFSLVVAYYEALLPGMVLMILPTAFLFATLYTLLDLNRTSQLVAMQACGVHIGTIFIPFLTLGVLCTGVLYFLTLGPGAGARARQNEIMDEMRNRPGTTGVYHAQVYRNHEAHRTWYLETLSVPDGTASGADVCEQDEAGHDLREVFAREAVWTGDSWNFSDAMVETFDAQGNVATRQIYDHFPAPDWNDAPREMVKVLLKPDEMGLGELRRTLAEPELAPNNVSQYETQLYYLLVYPWAVLVLLLFALPQGLQYGRRHVGAGVFNAIFLLLAFYFVWNFFLAMGRGGRLPALASVLIPMGAFAVAGVLQILPLLGIRIPLRLPGVAVN